MKQGDLTAEPAEGIVNAANSRMVMGGGVAAAIRRKAGASLEEEARKHAPVPAGRVVVTGGGQLPARYVLHAVSVDDHGHSSAELVRQATRNVLGEAERLGLASLAFPALGCGVGGLTIPEAATVMLEESLRHTATSSSLRTLTFVLWSETDFGDFLAVAEPLLGQLTAKAFRNPLPTVDIIIEKEAGVVLVKRKNYPPGWAIPGGFVDYGESLEEAAVREAREETGLAVTHLEQFHTYSRPGRDPRFHTIATVFVGRAEGHLCAGDDAGEIGVFSEQQLPRPLAFDHLSILTDYFTWCRAGRPGSGFFTEKEATKIL